MQKTELWLSPKLCGCVLTITHTWSFSQRLRDRILEIMGGNQELADKYLADLDAKGQWDKGETIATEIHSQCAEHAGFTDAASLYAELLHFYRPNYTLNTCGCIVTAWYDSRTPPEKRIHTPANHPTETKCCRQHAHLTDHVEHFATVTGEHGRINHARHKVAEALGLHTYTIGVDADGNVSAEKTGLNTAAVKFSLDKDRNVVIDHDHLGISAEQVKKILAT